MNLIGFLIALAVLSSNAWSAQTGAAKSPAPSADVEAQLQAAVKQSLPQVSTATAPLDSVQKNIFDQEVVPNAALFVKDYRPANTD